ncbi:hypothetical protein K440DRAFT_641520 [Wilcoxina mikolae CBS 423.85]|nr:hypothetical protein K440DRAFT_641520 [Wilcoxina mikolae CBS 423.85]
MFKRTYFPMPLRAYSPIRTLVVAIFLLLAVLPVASSIKVPPPLPEHEWAGKSSYNYTELHAHFAEVLVCLYIPVGVFGFYYWFVFVLIIIFSLSNAASSMEDEERPSIISTIMGILTTTYSIFGLYQNVQTVRYCSHLTGFGAVHGVIIVTLIGSCLSAAGGILMVARIVYPYTGVVACVFIHKQWDKVRLGAMVVALIPWGLIELLSIGVGSNDMKDLPGALGLTSYFIGMKANGDGRFKGNSISGDIKGWVIMQGKYYVVSILAAHLLCAPITLGILRVAPGSSKETYPLIMNPSL